MDYLAEMQSLLVEREALLERVRVAYESRGLPTDSPLLATPAEDTQALGREFETLKARENALLLRLRGH